MNRRHFPHLLFNRLSLATSVKLASNSSSIFEIWRNQNKTKQRGEIKNKRESANQKRIVCLFWLDIFGEVGVFGFKDFECLFHHSIKAFFSFGDFHDSLLNVCSNSVRGKKRSMRGRKKNSILTNAGRTSSGSIRSGEPKKKSTLKIDINKKRKKKYDSREQGQCPGEWVGEFALDREKHSFFLGYC